MAEFTLKPRSVFEGAADAPKGGEGIHFAEGPARGLVSLAARRGGGDALRAALEAAEGLTLPGPGRYAASGALTAMASAPGQWLIAAEGEADPEARIRAAAGIAGDVTDISDGFVSLRLSGPGARDALARISTLDFTDAAFPVGAFARTRMMQIGVAIRRLGGETGPAYALETPRSTARSFAHEVNTAIRSAVAAG
ncbi:MAG: sarcosine oxidase subunit gamma [Pikeienuella sp.]